AEELGLDVRAMSSLKPWAAAVILAAMKLRKLGFDPEVGVDRYFADRANQAGKPVHGLETPEFQIELLDQMSRGDQELMLLQTLKEMDLLEDNVGRIISAWKNGRSGAMEKLMLASMRETPEVRRKLIDDRNRSWVPQLEQILSGGDDVLVVVGAAHLVGRSGVIELLKQRGYRVEQE
ncbi:MAG TPA: TraB/GumN family protein, partial [Terriglobales bacterium]|nr:TraB/GumN family protein [Terriglobales bacterium]